MGEAWESVCAWGRGVTRSKGAPTPLGDRPGVPVGQCLPMKRRLVFVVFPTVWTPLAPARSTALLPMW